MHGFTCCCPGMGYFSVVEGRGQGGSMTFLWCGSADSSQVFYSGPPPPPLGFQGCNFNLINISFLNLVLKNNTFANHVAYLLGLKTV